MVSCYLEFHALRTAQESTDSDSLPEEHQTHASNYYLKERYFFISYHSLQSQKNVQIFQPMYEFEAWSMECSLLGSKSRALKFCGGGSKS